LVYIVFTKILYYPIKEIITRFVTVPNKLLNRFEDLINDKKTILKLACQILKYGSELHHYIYEYFCKESWRKHISTIQERRSLSFVTWLYLSVCLFKLTFYHKTQIPYFYSVLIMRLEAI
jgi:hypothetical protein